MMHFRQITPRDVPALFAVRTAVKENALSLEQLAALGLTPSSVTAMLLTPHHGGWLAEDRGQVVGFAMGDAQTGELGVIAVLPEYEGRGIGSGLMDRVEAWLAGMGWSEIWLWTAPDPTLRAYAFYCRRGWVDWEFRERGRFMKKRFPPPQ